MAAVWVLARAGLRRRGPTLLGLALVVGLASGAVMAAAIGARRTDTAYARLLQATLADDVQVEVGGYDPGFVGGLRRLPQVADLGLESVALVAPAMPGDPREYGVGTRVIFQMSVEPAGRPHRAGCRAGDARPHRGGQRPGNRAGGQPGRGRPRLGRGPDPTGRRPPQRVGTTMPTGDQGAEGR
jgi:hypothetical protein